MSIITVHESMHASSNILLIWDAYILFDNVVTNCPIENILGL